jgi:ribonuclease P protein component
VGLPSQHRLTQRSDFQIVYQQGIRRYSQHFILRAVLITPESSIQPIPTKIGVSISRKISKKAVVRNRLKRVIRACFIALLPQITPNWLILISLKSEVQECKYEHFLRELKELLTEAKIIYGN